MCDRSRVFGLDNLPYGAISRAGEPELVTRLGDHAVPLAPFEREAGLPEGTLSGPVLNPLLALGPDAWAALRGTLQERLQDPPELIPLAEAEPRLPLAIGDYVDFYSSLEHASNLGPHLPARLRAAAAELARAAGRLPRPRRLGRGVRHAGPPPAGPAPRRRPPRLRPQQAARHRARARLRHRPARDPDQHLERRRPRLRLRARQRLERARHPALGVRRRSAPSWASRSRPRSRPGSPRWRRSSPTACPPRRRTPSRSSTCAPRATGRSTSRSRSS